MTTNLIKLLPARMYFEDVADAKLRMWFAWPYEDLVIPKYCYNKDDSDKTNHFL